MDFRWDEKGLVGDDFHTTIEHLRTVDMFKKAKDSHAARMAKVLLDFHKELVWVSEVTMKKVSSLKRKRNSQSFQGGRQKESFPTSIPGTESLGSQTIQPISESILGTRSASNTTQSGFEPDHSIHYASQSIVVPAITSTQEPPRPEETLLHFDALDFVSPHFSTNHASNILSVTDLDFLAPLLDTSSIEFVNPQPGVLDSPPLSPVFQSHYQEG